MAEEAYKRAVDLNEEVGIILVHVVIWFIDRFEPRCPRFGVK